MWPVGQGHISKWYLFRKRIINDQVGGVWREKGFKKKRNVSPGRRWSGIRQNSGAYYNNIKTGRTHIIHIIEFVSKQRKYLKE